MSEVKKITPMSNKEKTQFLMVVSMLGFDRLTVNYKQIAGRKIFTYKFDKTKMEDDLVSQTPHFEFLDIQSSDSAKLSLKCFFELIDRTTIKNQRKIKDKATKEIKDIVEFEAGNRIDRFIIADLFEAMLFAQEKAGLTQERYNVLQENIDKLKVLELDETVLDWSQESLNKTKIVAEKSIKL